MHTFNLHLVFPLANNMFCLLCTGGELCVAGKTGRSQTDAYKTGHSAACCQKDVPADGLSAQQDALLQCKIPMQLKKIFNI